VDAEKLEHYYHRRLFFYLVDYVDCRFRISDAAKGARTVIAEVVFMCRMHFVAVWEPEANWQS
jgi:hypothetical protein